MRRTYSAEFGSALALLMLSTASATAAHKSPRECNAELYSRLGAIKAAGETPAQFVHDCWWHAEPGRPTPLAQREPVLQAPTALVAEARPEIGSHSAPLRRLADAGRAVRLKRRMARAVRLAHLARAAHRGRAVAERSLKPRLVRRDVARGEIFRRRRDRLAAAEIRPSALADGDLRYAAASLGPSVREGQRMWVRVVAAGEVHMQPAVAVGGLSEGATRTSALNCWGQPVLFVGRDANRWSRAMVCDGKPAGDNEWSAQIYYGGAPAR